MQVEVAAKRQALIDALTLCLERSPVKQKLPVETIRHILQSAAGELWREGEFHLELIWKVLTQQPNVSAMEVAPSLLAFKQFEQALGVSVRIPHALSAIPRNEQLRLLETTSVKLEDIEQVMARLKEKPDLATHLGHAAQAAAAPVAAAQNKSWLQGRHPVVDVILGAVTLLAVGFSLWYSLRDTSKPLDVTDAAAVLKIADARMQGHSVVARLADPRWDSLPKEEQKKLAAALFEKLELTGIRDLTLIDSAGRVRVMASDLTGSPSVTIH